MMLNFAKMDQQPFNMTDIEYKSYHESRMVNNHGSSALHTFLCIFFSIQCTLLCAISNSYTQPFSFIYEYVCIVLPLMLAHTVFHEYIYTLNVLMFLVILIKLTLSKFKLNMFQSLMGTNYLKNNRIHSISCIRGLTYLITVFSILAVDFESFPRHLAKTEKNGYSLMDTGVGLFVLMSGLVHKDMRHRGIAKIFKSNIRFILILLILGITRFVSLKQLNYHEHVTEYGVHWNFFFTLAVCKLISSIVLSYSQNELVTSLLILLIHECLLYIRLESWVFSNLPRNTLISANREGIASSLGYVSLYLFAAHLKTKLQDGTATRYAIQLRLMLLSILLWIASVTINKYRQTSRTLANAAYCVYLDAILVTVMFIMYLFETLSQNKTLNFQVPNILKAINNNGLVFFLVANVMTGSINLLIRTLFVTTFNSIVILNMYMLLSLLLTVYLEKKGIRI